MRERRDVSALIGTVARELLAEADVQQTLQRAVELAAEHLAGGRAGGQVYASVSLVRGRRLVENEASSDERATRADMLQYELGQGPCLDAIWERETFQVDDLTTEARYPQWSRRVARDTGIRSSLSFQLFTSGDSLGALNLYCPYPHGFDAEDRRGVDVRCPRPWRWRARRPSSSCARRSPAAPSWARPRAS